MRIVEGRQYQGGTMARKHPKKQAPAREKSGRQSVAAKRDADGLIGQTGKNRNLTGSTTYETLPDQGESDSSRSR